MDEKIEVSSQKMDIRTVLGVALCGEGLHLKIPPKIVKMYDLETGDKIHLQLKIVKYCNLREISKI